MNWEQIEIDNNLAFRKFAAFMFCDNSVTNWSGSRMAKDIDNFKITFDKDDNTIKYYDGVIQNVRKLSGFNTRDLYDFFDSYGICCEVLNFHDVFDRDSNLLNSFGCSITTDINTYDYDTDIRDRKGAEIELFTEAFEILNDQLKNNLVDKVLRAEV